jgi:hypothetical protein
MEDDEGKEREKERRGEQSRAIKSERRCASTGGRLRVSPCKPLLMSPSPCRFVGFYEWGAATTAPISRDMAEFRGTFGS